MHSLVSEIATASSEQDRGISQLTTAVQQMDKVTQSNASNAEQTASASEQLNAHAATLKETVMQMRMLVGGSVLAASGESSRTSVHTGAREVRGAPSGRQNPKPSGGRFLSQ